MLALGWPQYIVLVVIFLGLVLKIAKANGWRPIDKTSDVQYAVGCFTYPAFWIGMLYWGGFFTA